MSQHLTIGPGTRVTLHFALRLAGGEEVDSTWQGRPATFEVGDGNLLSGFEEALFGLQAGDAEAFQVPPERAFGMPNPDNLQWLTRDAFPPDMELQLGLVVSFADAANAEVPGVIKEIQPDQVLVDFNHPLAGQTITFDVRIIRVEPQQ